MKPLLPLLFILCYFLGGGSSEQAGKPIPTAFDPVVEFRSRISCHNFDSASFLVAEPSQFYRAKMETGLLAKLTVMISIANTWLRV
tara:strand:- start:6756 stop:7013 length:258 start_codon:yes stop_codon:yes gene_type:complete